MKLPPRLAKLLQVLSVDNGRSDDDLLGWWSADEIAVLLAKKGIHRVTKHTVSQWIYRLRNYLTTGGYDWRLVQTDRRRGVRLALRRDATLRIRLEGSK